MDELDLMGPLTYELEEDDDIDNDLDDNDSTVKSGRKRSGSQDVASSQQKSTKRQRTGNNWKALSELNTIEVGVDDVEEIPAPETTRENRLPPKERADVSATPTFSNSARRLENKTLLGQGGGRPVTDVSDENSAHVTQFRRVLKRIPQDIPYIPMTCQDGTRLYLRLKEEPKQTNEEEESSVPLMSRESNKHLFENWNQIKEEARIIKDKFHKELAKAVENDVFPVENNQENEIPDCLWVEKYKPRSFLDLLSQESVNKALLHWVKMWDKAVYGNDYLAKIKATRQKYAKLEEAEKEKEEKFQRKPIAQVNEEYDDGGRPSVKVALLAGDPGLGKTTCAHIIAKHAGYNIREMNASDDRSIEIFKKVLDDTTQSRSEIFQEGKPNCLVIDEIDGAPLASVNVLVELMLGNATEAGKKKAKKVLRRPVICICNDLYAPSLKLLRKHAFILQFPAVTVPRLVDRLTEVSDHEKLYLDLNSIKALCQKSECDIRSCLSTLQFLKRKRCSPKDALFSQIGHKDKSKGIFAVWGDIFTLPQEKRYQDAQPDPLKPQNRYKNVLQSVQSHGEYDKLFGGVLENYLNVKYRDAYMQSVIDGLQWAVWFEDMKEYIEKTQTYVLFGYLPMYFVMAHFIFARRDPPKIQLPSAELSSRTPKYQNAIKAQISETQPSAARFLDAYMLITDIFPAILNIIQPCSIRPVPTQIWTQRERETLQNVVDIMLTYNLCYTQTKHPETGAYSFVLEPDLEEMVKFKLQDTIAKKKAFPYAIKQLVAREIETEKLRRNDMVPDIVQRETFKLPQTPKAAPSPKIPDAVSRTPVSVARDFFGRPILPSADVSPEGDLKKKAGSAVYYKFKEGFSNAVRRFVKMRDLS